MENNLGAEKIALRDIIKSVIAEKGAAIVADTDAFTAEIENKSVDKQTLLQLELVLRTSNMRNFLSRESSNVNMIDINNIISCAERETGLTNRKVRYFVTEILEGCSKTSLVYDYDLPLYRNTNKKITDILSEEECKAITNEFSKAISEKNEEKIKNLAPQIEKCIKSGYADAFYLKGIMFRDGIATEPDWRLAVKNLMIASRAGNAFASAALGDMYYPTETYRTLAYKEYTHVGAVALSKERRENLKTIMAGKKQNIISLFAGGILFIVLFILNILIGKGMFSVDLAVHWASTITSNVILSLMYIGSFFYVYFNKYGSYKWIIVAMLAVFALTTIIAL